jgi:hypothetical protein
MTNWHMIEGGRSNVDTASYRAFNIPTGANDALSSWTEIVTSTPEDFYGFHLEAMSVNRSSAEYMFDIAIGDSGSEVILIDNFVMPMNPTTNQYRIGPTIYFPFFIPAGSDMHVRGRSSYTAAENGIHSGLRWNIDNLFSGLHVSQSQSMHINTSISNSRSIDPGGIVDTWGSWADVQDGPLAIDAKWVIICTNGIANVSRTSCNWNIQLGVGASGSEQPIQTFVATCNVSSDMPAPWVRYFPVSIPAGTTLRHRAMCDITDATDRLLGISYYFFA